MAGSTFMASLRVRLSFTIIFTTAKLKCVYGGGGYVCRCWVMGSTRVFCTEAWWTRKGRGCRGQYLWCHRRRRWSGRFRLWWTKTTLPNFQPKPMPSSDTASSISFRSDSTHNAQTRFPLYWFQEHMRPPF